MKTKTLLVILGVLTSMVASSQPSTILNGILLGETVPVVSEKIGDISKETVCIEISTPKLPVASQSESHIIAQHVKTKNGELRKAIFTFADGKLVCIEARGNVENAFIKERTDASREFLGLDVYMSDMLFYSAEDDLVKIMTEEAMHAMLFAWSNPFVNGKREMDYNVKEEIVPKFLKMGGTLEKLMPEFESNSQMTASKELDGNDPNATLQVNCFAVRYLGFPRKIEARFANDVLTSAWLLTSKGEESRIRQALISQYGKPVLVNDNWEVFNQYQVALRKDKPEILLLSKRVANEYMASGYFN